ncbi:MAG: DUF58 domain-containing protein [Micromonosporaceae bacterium]|nr:DUF58 domain-containing protein [Micromonosporaceae bacterium]
MSRLTRTGWGVAAGAALLAAGGLVAHYAALAGLGLAGLAYLLLAFAFLAVRPRLSVQRSVSPNRVPVGIPATGRLTVRNAGRLTAPRFEAVESVDGRPLTVPVAALAPRTTAELAYPIATSYRGLLRLGPLVLRRVDPLGLARRDLALSGRDLLWVHPRIHRVAPLPVGVALDFEGRLTDAAPHGSTAFASLREYAPGDDPRHIHWPSTARTGTLLVREHVDTTEPSVAMVLDTRSDLLDQQAFETAVEVCASVAAAAQRVGHTVSLVALGEDAQAVTGLGGHGILDRLAALSRVDGPQASLVQLAERAPGGGCLLVATGRASGLAAQLAGQRRRFSRVLLVHCGRDERARTLRRPGMTVVHAPDAASAARSITGYVTGGQR